MLIRTKANGRPVEFVLEGVFLDTRVGEPVECWRIPSRLSRSVVGILREFLGTGLPTDRTAGIQAAVTYLECSMECYDMPADAAKSIVEALIPLVIGVTKVELVGGGQQTGGG